MIDTVLRGIVGSDFDVTLDRAAAFAHIVGVGQTRDLEFVADAPGETQRLARAYEAGELGQAADSEQARAWRARLPVSSAGN